MDWRTLGLGLLNLEKLKILAVFSMKLEVLLRKMERPFRLFRFKQLMLIVLGIGILPFISLFITRFTYDFLFNRVTVQDESSDCGLRALKTVAGATGG